MVIQRVITSVYKAFDDGDRLPSNLHGCEVGSGLSKQCTSLTRYHLASPGPQLDLDVTYTSHHHRTSAPQTSANLTHIYCPV